MKSSVRKTLLAVLISLFALCMVFFGVFEIMGERPNPLVEAAEEYTYEGASDVQFTTDAPETLMVGDTFNLVATFRTTRADTYWAAMDVTFGTLNANRSAFDPTIAECFEFQTDEWGDPMPDFGPLVLTTSGYSASVVDQLSSGSIRIAISCYHKSRTCASSTVVPVTIPMKVVKEIPVSSVTFGIITDPATVRIADMVTFGRSGTPKDNAANFNCTGLLSTTPAVISTGAANSGVDLAGVKVGHGTASESLTVSTAMTAYSTSTTKNNYKIDLSLTDLSKGAAIRIGTSKPLSTTVTEGTPATVTLGNSGTTTVYINVTAQDKSQSKEYTIQVISRVAQLSGAAVAYQPAVSGATQLGLSPNFSAGTTSYTVKVPNNVTSASITPTVLANFGINGSIAATATNCSLGGGTTGNVASGTALNITNIGDSGAKVVLQVTAADGTTKNSYTFNFTKLSTDTSITSFTVTANDPSSSVITNDTTQGVDYYFKLPAIASGDSKGKMNITVANGSTVKIGSTNYNANTEYAVGSYTVRVTAPAGNYRDYQVTIAREQVDAVFQTLGIRLPGEASFTQLLTGDSHFNTNTNTYTNELIIGGANVIGASIYIEGTVKIGVEYSGKSSTLTGPSGDNDTFTGKLALGKNEYSITVKAGSLTNTYKFNIKLVEKKAGIVSVDLLNAADSSAISGFQFDPAIKTYEVSVPYATDSVKFNVTTDGAYAYVKTGATGAGQMNKANHPGTRHEYSPTAKLAVGETTYVFRAVADEGKATTDDNQVVEGDLYTVKIVRAAADTNSKLRDLEVRLPDGTKLPFVDGDGNEVPFNPNSNNQIIKYGKDASEIASMIVNFFATPEGKNVKITYGGLDSNSYQLPPASAITGGTVPIGIVVTAEDGRTTTEYTINIVTEEFDLGKNFDITKIIITGSNSEIYFKDFVASTHEYPAINVPYEVEHVSITVETYAAATQKHVVANGTELALGENMRLSYENPNTLVIYAVSGSGNNSDGAIKYMFTINREAPKEEVYLDDLRINGATVSGFDKDVNNYTSSQEFGTQSVVFRAVANDEDAKITVMQGNQVMGEGNGSVNIDALALGQPGSSITLTINLEIGIAKNSYTLVIHRATDQPVLVWLEVYDGGTLLQLYDDATNALVDGTDPDSVSVTLRNFKVKTSNTTGKMTIVAKASDPTAIVNLAIVAGPGLTKLSDNEWEVDMTEVFASSTQGVQIVIRPVSGSLARDVHIVTFKRLSSETNFGLAIKEIEEFNKNYEEYRNGTNIDFAPTFLQYTVDFNQGTLTFEVNFSSDDPFVRGTYQILRKRDLTAGGGTVAPTAFRDGDNQYGDILADFTSEPESVVPIAYGLNVLVVNLRSSDGLVTQPIVIIVERELPDFKAISVYEIESFAEDYKNNSDYRSKEEKYVYTVGNNVTKLSISIENFEELESEIIGADSLKVGKNEVVIYLYEKESGVAPTASREGREPVKTVILSINREEAQDNMKTMWMILFFVALALAVILLLILIIIPKNKRGAAQQVILAPAPYIQPPMMQQPQRPQQPQQNGKSPVNVEVRITGDGMVQTNTDYDGHKKN